MADRKRGSPLTERGARREKLDDLEAVRAIVAHEVEINDPEGLLEGDNPYGSAEYSAEIAEITRRILRCVLLTDDSCTSIVTEVAAEQFGPDLSRSRWRSVGEALSRNRKLRALIEELDLRPDTSA